MARPLVLHIPHSSRQIPTEERARFLLEDAELDAELLRMTDAFTEELFPSTNAEAGRVVQGVSRLLCDLERFREDVLEPMAAKGMGALYVKTSDGRALRKPIEAQERRRLMDLITIHTIYGSNPLCEKRWNRKDAASWSIATALPTGPTPTNSTRLPTDPTFASAPTPSTHRTG